MYQHEINPLGWCIVLSLLFLSTEVSYSHVQGQVGDEDTAVDTKLYSHRWRRWVPPKPRNMDSNRASQEQDRDPEEPEGFPGLLSAEEADNSSQVEVGDDSCKSCPADLWQLFWIHKSSLWVKKVWQIKEFKISVTTKQQSFWKGSLFSHYTIFTSRTIIV